MFKHIRTHWAPYQWSNDKWSYSGRMTRASQFHPLGNTFGCISVGLRREGSLSCDHLQTTELSDHVCTGKATELVFVS